MTEFAISRVQPRVQKVKDYYDGITAHTGQNVIGEVCVNEGDVMYLAPDARIVLW